MSDLGLAVAPPLVSPVEGMPLEDFISGRASSYVTAIEDILEAWERMGKDPRNQKPPKAQEKIKNIYQLPLHLPPVLLRGMFELVSPLDRDPVTGDMRDRRSSAELMSDPREVKAALEGLRRVFPNIQIEENDIALASLVGDEDFRQRLGSVLEAINTPE